MDDLGDLLAKRKLQLPPEVTALLAWCRQEYPAFTVKAQQRTRDYLLTVPNGALAQEVQMRLVELRSFANLPDDMRLTIRIDNTT